jgi:DNA modification methylase
MMSKAPILTPFLDDADVILYAGDCIEVMARMPEASVDAIVTDPPYGLEFMGKDWDGFGTPLGFQTWSEAWAREAFRVLKHGGHLLAFAGTRTYHRMASGVEDAGFEIRDCIAWMYGSGFPKSLDVSKAIDKTNGESGRAFKFTAWMQTTGVTARQINNATATQMGNHYLTHPTQPAIPTAALWKVIRPLCGVVPAWVDELVDRIEAEREVIGERDVPEGHAFAGPAHGGDSSNKTVNITTAATPAAQKWNGWGTALKPAYEPIVVARKPLTGTVAQNVLEHGTGALNIDATRIGYASDADKEQALDGDAFNRKDTSDKGWSRPWMEDADKIARMNAEAKARAQNGRWPANIALDETAAKMLDQQSGHQKDGTAIQRNLTDSGSQLGHVTVKPPTQRGEDVGYGGAGGASRFFYTAKASRQDRNAGGADNTHPTVKPTELMRWLIRLVTPPGGIILDPFGGSGSTGLAARAENARCILIEREPEYLEIIRQRLSQLSLLSELLDTE